MGAYGLRGTSVFGTGTQSAYDWEDGGTDDEHVLIRKFSGIACNDSKIYLGAQNGQIR